MAVMRSWSMRLFVAGFGLAVAALGGCQVRGVSTAELTANQEQLTSQEPAPLLTERDLHITCAPPAHYQRLRTNRTLLYTHQQWRALSRNAGFGVVYIHTPVAVSPEVLLWFAKSQYAQKEKPDQGRGRLLRQWIDRLNRHWFECENGRYHVRGYAMCQGLDNWIIYSGWRVRTPATPKELQTIQAAVESVAPVAAP